MSLAVLGYLWEVGAWSTYLLPDLRDGKGRKEESERSFRPREMTES
jgi:hypothetical protein